MKKVMRNENFKLRNSGGSFYLIPKMESNKENIKLYDVNATTAAIWNFLKRGREIEEIAKYILDKYIVAKGVDINGDIREFVDMLSSEDLIIYVEEKPSQKVERNKICIDEHIVDDIYDAFKLKSPYHRIPIAGSLELTHRCNLRCIHCYCPRGSINNELSLKDIKRITIEAMNEGCLYILLTGGEPLLRRDFQQIYAYLKEKGFIISLYTNGTLINTQVVNLLKTLPPFKLEITIYGATKDTYESVTCVPGSFALFVYGVKLLVENDIPFSLKTVVLQQNKKELSQMSNFASSLGVDFRFDFLIHPRLNGSNEVLNYRITPEEAIECELFNQKKRQTYRELLHEDSLRERTDPYLFSCMGGRTGYNIDPYGNISICTLSQAPKYDLRRVSFNYGWEALKTVIDEQYPMGYKCGTCFKYRLCRACPALAELEIGDKYKPISYLCDFADGLIKNITRKERRNRQWERKK